MLACGPFPSSRVRFMVVGVRTAPPKANVVRPTHTHTHTLREGERERPIRTPFPRKGVFSLLVDEGGEETLGGRRWRIGARQVAKRSAHVRGGKKEGWRSGTCRRNTS